jgi:hypothetical protein
VRLPPLRDCSKISSALAAEGIYSDSCGDSSIEDGPHPNENTFWLRHPRASILW